MACVKVGTRLTAVLLLALTPVLAGYMYWSVARSAGEYANDLKREIRATTHGLAPALENDLRAHEFAGVNEVLARISTAGTIGALVAPDGRRWLAPARFHRELLPSVEDRNLVSANGFAEFQRTVGGRHWFCRLVALKARDTRTIAYLLIAQDWSEIREDLRERTLGAILAALLVVAVIVTVIAYAIRRYVSDPLAELSRKAVRFSNDGDGERSFSGDEVRLLTTEFRRLDEQLVTARTDLTAKHRHELELERRLQRAERLATIGTLASGLAHEIGTPMGVIRGRAEYLLRAKPGPIKVREGLEIIIRQIDRISGIVRMLLDYARDHESRRGPCELGAIVQHALSLVETEATRRKLAIQTELSDEALLVECDPHQLEQVFLNLAMNAFDAMAPNGGTLKVASSIEEDGDSRRARIAFEDTGSGIKPEHLTRVFDPFFTTKEPGKGTGMGLAVSQSIMRDHNGEITVESAETGTRFIVALPILRSVAPPPYAQGFSLMESRK